jgi:hypothetical protein
MAAMSSPAAVPPETRDWTFVITDGCPRCGFVPPAPQVTGERLRESLPAWRDALARPDAAVRPAPTVWSTVEYGCHVRDACRIFRERLELMLERDDPTFPNWDQDATAVAGDYFHQDAATVSGQVQREAAATAAAFDAVRPEQWDRPGRRGNGSVFTVATFATYFLHDIEHHVWDVRR